MKNNFLGNKIKWIWVMRKLNTPLSVSSYPVGTAMGKKVFGYPKCLTATWYDRGDIYFDREEIQQIKHFIKTKFGQDPLYPDKIAKSIFLLAQKIERQKIDRQQLEKKSLVALLSHFKKERILFMQMIGFMSYRGSVEMSDVLSEKMTEIISYRLTKKKKLAQLKKVIEMISVPSFSSVIAEEKVFALKLAKGFNQLNYKQQIFRVKKYLRKYEWLAYHWFVGTPPSEKQVITRFKKFASKAQYSLNKIKQEHVDSEKQIQQIKKELHLNAHEKRVIEQYRTWLLLRTFVKDNINYAGYKLLPILYQIAKRVGIPGKQISLLTLNEIDHIKKYSQKQLLKIIRDRKDGFSAGIIGLQFSFSESSRSKQKATTNKILKGMVAYRGKISGTVKVIMYPREQTKLKRGEILVSSMTTPDLLPAMERAAAFITDEGGITSHAAIIAREMKKPCIIGTKLATKYFKDGDKVFVDAEKGEIKKI